MGKKSIKESILSYISPGGNFLKLNEEGPTGPAGPAEEPKKQENDPDKDAKNPDVTDFMGEHRSIIFLTAPDSDGIIRRGGNLGFIELTPSIVEKEGLEIDLEDFQWYSSTDDFNAYLDKTGRAYNKNTGDWTSESEDLEDLEEIKKERKISSYFDFLNEREKTGALNELSGIPLLGNVGTNVTSKGMEFQGEDPDFQGGKLSDSDRKFIRFIFTRNHLRNTKEMEEQLDLTKLKVKEKILIFVTAFDPATGDSDDTAMIAITFEVKAVIPAQGDIAAPMVVGIISHISPNLGTEGGGFSGVLEKAVEVLYSTADKFGEIFSTTTGTIFATVGGIAAVMAVVPAVLGGVLPVFQMIHQYRLGQNLQELTKAVKGVEAGSKAKRAKNITKVAKPGRLGNFLKYPLTMVKRYRTVRKSSLPAIKSMKGWKLARYIAFGKKARALGKTASVVARGSRVLTGIAKWSNPVGWVLLAADAIGSTLNYTSDNQAPSWDPLIGGEGDSMKDYSKTICKTASNVFSPQDIPEGENITLCWTQNPESGFSLALSFVVSVSTRTTMNLTKIANFPIPGASKDSEASICLFLINNVNYKPLWDKIKGFDLRFLFIQNGEYTEGYVDDNIGAYFLGAKSQPEDKDSILPISYYGHCNPAIFMDAYNDMQDQLIVVEKDAPDVYYFHFEDSESNIINVTGRKVKDSDLENASQGEIQSFFNVEPVSTYIGNPDSETPEERKERESIENSAKALDVIPEDQENEKSVSPEENTDLAKNENVKWYSSIDESKPISSFLDFKHIKESLLLEKDPPIEGGQNRPGAQELETKAEAGEKKEKNTEGISLGSQILTAKQIQENFEKILNTIEKPMEFSIYFVENREYADPELRDIYQPGSFMNFSLSGEAISASDGSDIEGMIQVNNLDVLLDAKKGIYSFSKKDKETNLKDEDLQDPNIKSGRNILTANITSARNKEEVSPLSSGREEEEEPKNIMQRMQPDQLKELGISNWTDVTSVKIIRDGKGSPETVKIKNRKAKYGDKSRSFEKGEPGFESALALAQANKDIELEDKESELSKR